MTFRPTVTIATPGQQLRWEGKVGVMQIFRGQHCFTLTASPDGTTRFTNHEEFSGVLVTLIGPLLPTPKNEGYATVNRSSSNGWKAARTQGTVTPPQSRPSPATPRLSSGSSAGGRR